MKVKHLPLGLPKFIKVNIPLNKGYGNHHKSQILNALNFHHVPCHLAPNRHTTTLPSEVRVDVVIHGFQMTTTTSLSKCIS